MLSGMFFLTYICEDEGAFKRFDPAQNSNRMSLTADTLQAERKKRKIPGNVPNLTTRLPTFQVSVVVVHWEGDIEARIHRHAINASKDEPMHCSSRRVLRACLHPAPCPRGWEVKGQVVGIVELAFFCVPNCFIYIHESGLNVLYICFTKKYNIWLV